MKDELQASIKYHNFLTHLLLLLLLLLYSLFSYLFL